MRKKRTFNKLLSFLLCVAMLASYLPIATLTASGADQTLGVVAGSKTADPSTLDGWQTYFGPQKMDTEFAGAVWTDKSVFASENNGLPGVALDDENNFLVSLSAIAANLSITGHASAPTDTMLVLDLSGSMVDDTYEVGTIRRGNNNYQTATGIDMSLITAMVEAVIDVFREEYSKWEKEEDVKFVLCTRLTDELTLLKRNYKYYVDYLRAPAAHENLVIDIIQRKIRDVILSAPEPEDYEALLDKVAKEFRDSENG